MDLRRRRPLGHAGSRTTTYTYNENGGRLTASDGTLVITTTYDRLSRVLTVDDEDPGTTADTTYTYSLTSPQWADPTGTYAVTLDAFDRATVLDDPAFGTGTFTWAYRADGQPGSVGQPNGNTTAYGYDGAGHLTDTTTTAPGPVTRAAYAWTVNRAGSILSEASTITSDPTNSTRTFAYDPLGRLAGFTDGALTTTWTFDPPLASTTDVLLPAVPQVVYRNACYATPGSGRITCVNANPFSYGSPVSGEYFDDRVEEVRLLVRRMTTGQNVVLTSPRRVGKTSLLTRAADEARRSGRARIGVASLLRCSNRREVAEEVTRAVVEGALGLMVGTAEQITDRLRRLPRITPSLEHDGWTFGLAVGGSSDDFLGDIRRPIELLADSAGDGRPVCLVLDEFQQVAEIDQYLGGFFKTVCDDLPGVSLVFSGSQKHMMDSLFVGPGAALKNAAEPVSLDVIPEPEMVAFVVERMASAGRAIDEDAARLLFNLVRGIPHFVQLLGTAVYDEDVSRSDGAVVRRALVRVLTRQRADLASRYEVLPLVQRRVLLGLARGPVRDLTSRAAVQRFDLGHSSIARARDALREKELIEFDARVGWRVSDPILELWLRYGLPLDLGASIDPDAIQ